MACKWNKDAVERFIHLYQQKPNLYDITHKDYYNRRLRNDHMEYISENLLGCNFTVEELKKKMKILRTQYNRQKYLIEKSKISGEAEDYEPNLWCYNKLKFLDPFVQISEGTLHNIKNEVTPNTINKKRKLSSTGECPIKREDIKDYEDLARRNFIRKTLVSDSLRENNDNVISNTDYQSEFNMVFLNDPEHKFHVEPYDPENSDTSHKTYESERDEEVITPKEIKTSKLKSNEKKTEGRENFLMKQNYYNKKIKLFEREVKAKEKIADAQQRSAFANQAIAEGVQRIVNYLENRDESL